LNIHDREDELLVRYLLGQERGTAAERIERDYFDDDGFYERLEAVEDELIDAYVRGRLSPTERERFEEFFLRDDERRERVAFARAWRTFVSQSSAEAAPAEEPARRRNWFWFWPLSPRAAVVPLAAVVLLALGAWLVVHTARLNRQIEQLRAERSVQESAGRQLQQQVDSERRRNEQLLAELEGERNRPETQNTVSSSLPVIVSFMLSPGLSRDAGDARRFAIPPEAAQVRLWAAFKAGDFRQLRAELQTVEGSVVWSQRGLTIRPRGDEKLALVTIPARRFKDADYILILKGVAPTGESSDVSEYSFRIIR
jgi:hypothetical protein